MTDARTSEASLPLKGLRVLEFVQTIMGPSCGLVLADLGADVIKVEPAEGDKTRRLSGFAAGFFVTYNRNKRSIAIDLKTEAGRDLVYRMVEQADIVTENFAPGTMDRLGCGYDALSKINPRLIYCSLKGFLSGPYENRQALDEVVQFMGGLAYMTGPRGRPLRAGASVIDVLGGTFGALAILAALRERDQTGRGQLVKSALYESTTYLMAQHMAGSVIAGKPVPPLPERWGAWAIYEPFETADGKQIFVGITSDNHWRRFCERFDRPDLLADPELKTNEQRVAARPRIQPIVADVVKRLNSEDFLRICEEMNIPFAPVARPEDLFDDPQLNAEGRMMQTMLPDGRTLKLPRLPIELDGHDLGLRRQPPLPGEHTREILREMGLGEAEIADLEGRSIVATKSRPAAE
ncbi:MAG: CaiB/BaiF CoA transferase family protein [Alphaproteobacteria bacterium]